MMDLRRKFSFVLKRLEALKDYFLKHSFEKVVNFVHKN